MANSRPFSVLSVDDDKAMRQSLMDLLTAAGWQAETKSRAMQVSAKLADEAWDVVLSDVQMPGLSGLELLNAFDLKSATPPVAHPDPCCRTKPDAA